MRDYCANLFGVPLKIRSLAFQEQDNEVAQCATSALWSVLQGTASKFGHSIPTPVEITKLALAVHAGMSRTFPAANGLNMEQLADAVRNVHLEPYCTAVHKREILQTESYAYLRAGIPALLGVTLWDTLDSNGNRIQRTDASGNPVDVAAQAFGDGESGHAIALTGFSLSNNAPTPYGQSGILLTATRIDKFYAHDDQIGAFSRLPLSPHGSYMNVVVGDQIFTTPFMETSWSGNARVRASVNASADMLLVPLYPKMRIPFKVALEATIEMDSIFELLRTNCLIPGLANRIEWDIHLTTSSELKSDESLVVGLNRSSRRMLLTSSMPRFIWRALGMDNGSPCVELLFDATAIVQGQFFLRAIEHMPGALAFVRNSAISGLNLSPSGKNIVEWFSQN